MAIFLDIKTTLLDELGFTDCGFADTSARARGLGCFASTVAARPGEAASNELPKNITSLERLVLAKNPVYRT
jgi:hypothetical protein